MREGGEFKEMTKEEFQARLGWFFDQWVQQAGVIDYALRAPVVRKEQVAGRSRWVVTAQLVRVGRYRHPMPVGVRTAAGWTVVRADPLKDALAGHRQGTDAWLEGRLRVKWPERQTAAVEQQNVQPAVLERERQPHCHIALAAGGWPHDEDGGWLAGQNVLLRVSRMASTAARLPALDASSAPSVRFAGTAIA